VSCAVFADVLVDLARDVPMEPAVRASALGHAASCRECGARLAEQRMLSTDLVALAAAEEGQQTPAWIETSLLARLRAKDGWDVTQREGEASGGATQRGRRYRLRASGGSQGGATQRPPAQLRRRWTWTSLTAAAVLLAVVGLLTAQKGPATPPRMAAETTTASPASGDGSFLALSYGDSLADLDAVQVVRVEVQPTALASLGWTLGAESDGPVEADLLVGQDGVARGIRFVD
jgi:hypothetical protein